MLSNLIEEAATVSASIMFAARTDTDRTKAGADTSALHPPMNLAETASSQTVAGKNSMGMPPEQQPNGTDAAIV